MKNCYWNFADHGRVCISRRTQYFADRQFKLDAKRYHFFHVMSVDTCDSEADRTSVYRQPDRPILMKFCIPEKLAASDMLFLPWTKSSICSKKSVETFTHQANWTSRIIKNAFGFLPQYGKSVQTIKKVVWDKCAADPKAWSQLLVWKNSAY